MSEEEQYPFDSTTLYESANFTLYYEPQETRFMFYFFIISCILYLIAIITCTGLTLKLVNAVTKVFRRFYRSCLAPESDTDDEDEEAGGDDDFPEFNPVLEFIELDAFEEEDEMAEDAAAIAMLLRQALEEGGGGDNAHHTDRPNEPPRPMDPARLQGRGDNALGLLQDPLVQLPVGRVLPRRRRPFARNNFIHRHPQAHLPYLPPEED